MTPGAKRAAAVAFGCVALAALSLLGPSSPTYDPWAWLVWGRELGALELSTEGGPAWKPLPVAVTALLASAGDAAPELWLVATRAAALAALALAWTLGRRLGGWPAAATALAALLAADGWVKHAAWGNAEAILVCLCLGAAELHLRDRRRWALCALAAAALIRPEAYLLVFAYGAWIWRDDHRLRPALALAAAAIPAAWTVPELLASGELGRSAERARQPDPGSFAAADSPTLEALGAAVSVPPGPVVAVLVSAIALTLVRRLPVRTLLPGAAAAAWAAVVAAMTAAGFAGAPRFLLASAALAGLGAGAIWALGVPRLGSRWRMLAPVLPLAIATWGAPGLVSDLEELRSEAALQDDLAAAVEGSPRLGRCATARTEPFRVPVSAWELGLPLRAVSAGPAGSDSLVLRHRVGRWSVRPCAGIRADASDLAVLRNTARPNGLRAP